MKTFTVSTEPVLTKFETRAAEALTSLLARVSAIKLLELKCESQLKRESELKHESQPARDSAAILARTIFAHLSGISATILARPIFAHIDIFGHTHTLACAVIPDGEPSHLRAQLRILLREFETGTAPLAADATPVLIAPYLSPEAQALLKQSNIGFLDLEGNARLHVGEIFIGMRSISRSSTVQPSAALHPFPARSAPLSIASEALPVPGALPAISRNRLEAVAVPA